MKKKKLVPAEIRAFKRKIYGYYRRSGRSFPWRETTDPYRVLVSEIMLQQTQTHRVLEKYSLFVAAFPDIKALAAASLGDVLRLWQGLGYNRRAMALKRIAELLAEQHKGTLPSSKEELLELPGIGNSTASAVLAFAFNKPSAFIETNIRTVYIHFFFHDKKNVQDSDVLSLVEQTLDKRRPREWYYALMDYGVKLKKEFPGINKKSAHYKKQSPLEGSNRQIRGRIIKLLAAEGPLPRAELIRRLKTDAQRAGSILHELEMEGFLKRKGSIITLP